MLKKGEVITKEVLPAFAIEVEKAFGLETVDKIDTLQARLTRANNAWTLFLDDISSEGTMLNAAYVAILDFTTLILESITDIDEKFKEVFKDAAEKQRDKNISNMSKMYSSTVDQLEAYAQGQDRLSASMYQEEQMLKSINDLLKKKGIEQWLINDAQEDFINKGMDELLPMLEDEYSIYGDLTNAENGLLLSYGVRLKAAQDVTQQTLNDMEITIGNYKRTLKLINDEIKALKEKQELESTSNAEYVAFQKQINELEQERIKITGELKKITEKAQFGSIQYLKDLIAEYEKSYMWATNDLERQKFLDLKNSIQGVLDLMEQVNREQELYTKNLAPSMSGAEVAFAKVQKWTKDNQAYLEVAGAAVQEFGNIGTEIFNRKIEQINAEIEAETRKYDNLMALAEDDAQQKKRLEYEKQQTIEKLEKERLKKEQQKAKYEKAQAIATISINTAIGISQANTKGLLGWWEIPIIAALGAAQIATVIAQPIPQYAEGLDEAKKDHIAMINDGGKKEYIERDGKILSTDTKNAVVQLKKGDTVYKDYNDMINKLNFLNVFNQGKLLEEKSFENLSGVIEDGLTKGFQKAKINNNIKLQGFDYAREAYKNKLQSWN